MLRRRRDQGIITLYHRVSPQPNLVYEPLHPDEFDRHCCLLKRHFTVIPLSEMLDLHHHGRSLAGLCSITFDDGYLDFRDQALLYGRLPLQLPLVRWAWRVRRASAR